MRGAMALACLCALNAGCDKEPADELAGTPGPLTVSYGDCRQDLASSETPAPADRVTDAGADAPTSGAISAENSNEEMGKLATSLFGDSEGQMGVGLRTLGCDDGSTAGAGGISGGGSIQEWGKLSKELGNQPSPCGPYHWDEIGMHRSLPAGPSRGHPIIKLDRAEVRGDLDKNIVRRYVRHSLSRLRDCYAKRLKHKPRLAGRAQFEWLISPEGLPLSVKVEGLGDRELESCLQGVIRAIQFPKPKGGGLVEVSYSLVLEPPRSRRLARVPRSASAVVIDAGVPDGAPDTAMAQATTPAPASGAESEPGPAGNPLATLSAPIEACLRQFSPPDGTVRGELAVEMNVDENGAVVKASVTGSDSDALRACVSERARALTYPASDRASRIYRCPIAFERSAAAGERR